MAAKAKAKDPQEVVDKVQSLIALAQDESNIDEARNAALNAVRIMSENKLAVVPQAHLEAVQNAVNGVKELARRAKDESNQKLLIGLVAGAMFGKKLF